MTAVSIPAARDLGEAAFTEKRFTIQDNPFNLASTKVEQRRHETWSRGFCSAHNKAQGAPDHWPRRKGEIA